MPRKVSRGRLVKGMTEKEEELLDTLVACEGDLDKAAEVIGISYTAAYRRLERFKLRVLEAKDLLDRARVYRVKLPGRWF